MEFSIIMKNGMACNMNCSYCSAPCPSTTKVEIDRVSLLKTLLTNPSIAEAKRTKQPIDIGFWGGEPLIKLEAIQFLMAFTEEHIKPTRFFISTNGKLLKDSKVLKFLEDNPKVKLQLSHDGIGQAARDPRGIDILLDPEIRANVVTLMKRGQLDLINTTMSQKNPSIMANVFYWQQFLWENNLQGVGINIKLNHIDDNGDDFTFHGEELRLYIHEMEKAMMASYLAPDSLMWKPFYDYFKNQATRYSLFHGGGSCAAFSIGQKDYTWCCNTLGEYVGCQLYDNNEELPCRDLKMPDYCKDCEYSKYEDCHPCPNSRFPPKCEYRKEFIRLTLRMEVFMKAIDALRGQKNGSCQCQC